LIKSAIFGNDESRCKLREFPSVLKKLNKVILGISEHWTKVQPGNGGSGTTVEAPDQLWAADPGGASNGVKNPT
jgi:hypothetical protein